MFPPRPSMRLVSDVIRFCTAARCRVAPGVDLRLPHPRGGLDGRAGARVHRRERLRVRRGRDSRPGSRRRRSRRACRSSSTRTSTSSRRSRSTAPRAASGPAGCATATARRRERSLQLRFHTQTAGVSLTAQQPEVNLVRTAIEALAGVLGGTQSLHTNSFDEALALPTEKAARLALRTQQVIAHETRVTNVADPLGGSWYVEELTDEMERQAEAIFAHCRALGGGSMLEGALVGIEQGWFQREIARGRLRPRAQAQRRPPRRWSASTTSSRATTSRRPRSSRSVPRCEEAAAQAARRGEGRPRRRRGRRARWPGCGPTPPSPTINLMPALLDAVRAYATSARSWTRSPTCSAGTARPRSSERAMPDGHRVLAGSRRGPPRASCPTTRASRCTRPGSTGGRVGPLLEIGSYCGKSARVPRRRGASARHGAVHDRPPPRLGGEPGRVGAPRHRGRRPAHRPHGHAAVLPAHDRGRRARGRRRRRASATRRPSARYWATPLGLLFIDGGHAEDVAMADYEIWARARRARAACSRSTTCSRTRPTAARRPFHVWQRAVADGFTPGRDHRQPPHPPPRR